jgi:hypothetical protein
MPENNCFRVSLDVRVFDEQRLFETAFRHATEPGSLTSPDDALKMLKDESGIDVKGCLAQLLDPDAPPPGVDIQTATIERLCRSPVRSFTAPSLYGASVEAAFGRPLFFYGAKNENRSFF